MRNCSVLLLSIVLCCSGSSKAQSPARSPRTSSPVRTEPDIRQRVIINPVFATGMVCDGFTDDSAALRRALGSAANPGLGNANATVIMPPGTCIIDPGASVSINGSIWLQGAGRFGTTLKRKNSSSGSSILLIGSSGVTLSDFAIDGNKGGPGIVSSADSVAAASPFSEITILRMRFANSTNSDIASYVNGAGNYTADWLIEGNDFENQGNPLSSCIISIRCANVRLLQPLRVRIIGNNSNKSQQFALFASIPGGGQIEVGQNTINNLDGFAVALG
jgi:hypothetical protein